MHLHRSLFAISVSICFVLAGCGPHDEKATQPTGTDASTEDSDGVDAASDAPADVQGQGSIRGAARLFDREDHGGITITVAEANLTTTTNPAGDFELTAVPAGVVTLKASLHPYLSRAVKVTVEPNEIALLDPLVLRLTRLLHAGDQDIPLAVTSSGQHALFGSNYSLIKDDLTLWVHAVDQEESVEVIPGVSRTSPLTAPDDESVAFLRNVDAKSGLGELMGLRLDSPSATALSQAVSEGKYWFSRNGHYLMYVTDFDEASNSGTLHATSTSDWTSRLLSTNVALRTIEEHEDGQVLWFFANFLGDGWMPPSGDLYRYEFGAAKADLVDTEVGEMGPYQRSRWLGGLGQPVLYLKEVVDYANSRLMTWAVNESPRTLGTSVMASSVTPSPDGKEVLFLADYTFAASSGTLKRWIAGTATPGTVAESVFDLMPFESSSHFFFLRDYHSANGTGTHAVWDFGSGTFYDLGASSEPWRDSRDGRWVGYYENFDKNAWSGDLHLFDTTTNSSTLVAPKASGYCLDFDLQSKFLLYHLNGNQSQGDLWLRDLSTGQNTLLAQNASQFTDWNEGSTMVAFRTGSNVHMRALDIGKTVSLGAAGSVQIGPKGHWATFYRSGLWVWDGSVDPWEGTNVGIEIKNAVDPAHYARPYADGLLMSEPGTWPLVTAFWWSRETRQWSAPITDAKLDSSSSNLDPATSPDRSLAWFFANVDAASYGDLYLVDPTCPDPILLGSRVHEEKVWIDDDWTRAVFLKNVSGGVGDAVVRDLTQGVSRDLGTSAASYGTIVSPQGKAVGVLHAWNGMVGTLSALNLGDPQGPPRKYDDQVNVVSSQVPYVITDKNVLYTVKDAERGGTYLAATP